MSDLQQASQGKQRQHGRVKFFDRDKGWGYITARDGKDYFLHQNECEGLLPSDGQRVSFELGTDNRGRPHAACVTVEPQ